MCDNKYEEHYKKSDGSKNGKLALRRLEWRMLVLTLYGKGCSEVALPLGYWENWYEAPCQGNILHKVTSTKKKEGRIPGRRRRNDLAVLPGECRN